LGRVLVIGLDGFEVSYADQLVAEGLLPTFAAQHDDAARVLLDHGPAQRSGLGWEHFWSGLTPQASGRESAVEFDVSNYHVWQEGARFRPFFADFATESVVFDTPYADLVRATGLRGVVAWGVHDPGLNGGAVSRPPGLVAEIEGIAGPYPATRWTYAVPWASADQCRLMGHDLKAGIEAREAAALWLLTERINDWDLAVVVISELHSGSEGLWHGVDPSHPLRQHPSTVAAGDALRGLYQATDRFVDRLVNATGASSVVVFSMSGMGRNRSDVSSMVLLPELLYRWAWGKPLLQVPVECSTAPDGVPGLASGPVGWERSWWGLRTQPPRIMRALHRVERMIRSLHRSTLPVGYMPLDWQPATWYRPWWPKMRAFALPSFYDGRIRVNLRGREARGVVDIAEYAVICDEIEDLLWACVDPRTGEPVVEAVERVAAADAPDLSSCGADLAVVWRGEANCCDHPQHGRIGPLPYRRTGGHTGPYGYAAISGPRIVPGDYGVASSFDVAPTILDLLGAAQPDHVSGTSLLDRLQGAGAQFDDHYGSELA